VRSASKRRFIVAREDNTSRGPEVSVVKRSDNAAVVIEEAQKIVQRNREGGWSVEVAVFDSRSGEVVKAWRVVS
jgi:hypothetical protein